MKLALRPTGGTAPEAPWLPSPVQRASFGGGSVPPPEPPQGATATIAETPFFSVANAFERTDRAMDFFL